MTEERWQELLDIHEEIEELNNKIVDLKKAKTLEPELYIPRDYGYSISIKHMNNVIYEGIIDYEIKKCQEEIEKLTKEFKKQ
jgi:hypothetical protein